jgi:hypothetical protein
MPEFIPGLTLSEGYYREAVSPILQRHFPKLPHSAALIGYGSDVLGLDTPVSCDHMWGPRVVLFLRPEDIEAVQPSLYEALRQELPVQFRGFSTHFGRPEAQDNGVRLRQDVAHGPVDPLIFFHTLNGFWQSELGFNPAQSPTPQDWLTFSQESLLSLTAGKVFHDDLGLEALRERFAWYPRDVWYYLLAAQWGLIAEEEAFVGRTATVGDDLGSRLVTARLVERIMRLCFLMEKRYPPYSKWFGSTFQNLQSAGQIGSSLQAALAANSYAEREAALVKAYLHVLEMHNALQITAPLEVRTRTFSAWHQLRVGVTDLPLEDERNTRPFQVLFSGRIVDAITAQIQDPQVQALLPHVGCVSQFLVESSPALLNQDFCRSLAGNLVHNR